jgi:hypothetical protein
MSTPVTAAEVVPESWIMHEEQLCHVTEKHDTDTGGVWLGWTELLRGQETYFHGTFMPNAYFGELTTI